MSAPTDIDAQIAALRGLAAEIDRIFEGVSPDVRDQVLRDLITSLEAEALELNMRVIAKKLASTKRLTPPTA
jgi:hypothetical protein